MIQDLISISKEVISDIKNGYYENQRGEEIEFECVDKMISGSKMYKTTEKIKKEDQPYFESTRIYAQNIDIYNKAIELGPRAVCLNMASEKRPGGGWLSGAKAAEESMCRRSNLIQSIAAFTPKGKQFYGYQKSDFYPLHPYGGIYSPYVNIYKNQVYRNLEEPRLTNVISVAAVRNPELNGDGTLTDKSEQMTKEKIKTILRIAILNGHSKLVLSAFGCGAFGNPPREIARCFKEIIETPEFNHCFSEICFAILDDHNAKGEGNYRPFKDVFGE